MPLRTESWAETNDAADGNDVALEEPPSVMMAIFHLCHSPWQQLLFMAAKRNLAGDLKRFWPATYPLSRLPLGQLQILNKSFYLPP